MDTKEAVAIIEEILAKTGIWPLTHLDAEITVPTLPQEEEDKLYALITDAHFEVRRLVERDTEGEYRYWEIKYKDEYLCTVFFD